MQMLTMSMVANKDDLIQRQREQIVTLLDALTELVQAVELKASARANPASYYSPRMEDAIERAKKLIDD